MFCEQSHSALHCLWTPWRSEKFDQPARQDRSVYFPDQYLSNQFAQCSTLADSGVHFLCGPCAPSRMLPSRVWRSLVSTFWRYSLSSPDSGVAATGSSKAVMTQLDNILDEVPASSGAEGQSADPSTVEDKEQALYGMFGRIDEAIVPHKCCVCLR